MSDPKLSDVQLQNLLAKLTDSFIAGDGDLHALARQNGIDSAEVQDLVELIEQLNDLMTPVEPSQRFVRRLHQDLMGTEGANMLVRVRRLPPRVQIAAGIALVAGFMIFSRRRMVSESHQESAQERAAAR